jgi:uncharacterized repeat protein (TIGR02543 family)
VDSLPAPPTRTGYIFSGWYNEANGAGGEVDWTAPITEHKTVYARWTAISYTVTFNANGGSEPPISVTVTYPQTTVGSSLPTTSFVRTGYIFTGWKDGNDVAFDGSTLVSADIEVFAQWTEISSITFNKNHSDDAGSYTVDESITTITVTATYSVSTMSKSMPSNPTRTGATFAGWYLNTDGTGDAFTNSTPVNANKPLYAKWTADYALGDTGPAGGTIVYDKKSFTADWRYLELAPVDTHASLPWAPNNTTTVSGTSDAIGTGKENTAKIIAAYSGATTSNCAAKYCASLTSGSKNDWFLPSNFEIVETYDVYKWSNESWSSTEGSKTLAGMLQTYDASFDGPNSVGKASKTLSKAVRAMRRF